MEILMRLVRFFSGWSLVAAGIVLIPLPGPGFLIILAGLTVLSSDSVWARNMSAKIQNFLLQRKK